MTDSVVLNLKLLYFPKASPHAYETPLPTSNVHRKSVLDDNDAQYACNDASLNFRLDLTPDILFHKALMADATQS
jgi:hypothetical protein